jgi:hypothetical protein
MAVNLDKDKLLEHLKAELEKRWNDRIDRPKEQAEWFYGPGGSTEPENIRDMRKLYFESYWDGVTDTVSALLTFDDDIRGVEALAALVGALKPGEG